MPPGDFSTNVTTSSAPTLAQFRDATVAIKGNKGSALELNGSGLKVVKHSVFDDADAKTKMREAKEAFTAALHEVSGNDPDKLAALKQLVDPKFDSKEYLSSAKVKSFFAKYQSPEAMQLAARIQGRGSDGVPHTLAERVQIAQTIAATWVDSDKFGQTIAALSMALDTLEQFKDSRLNETYLETKQLGLDFIGAFTAANRARENLVHDTSEASVAKLEASIKALEGMPKKIETALTKLQQGIENVQRAASQDLALSHWNLTNSTSAAILAKAELANKALGVIAVAVSTALGMPPVGGAFKAVTSGILGLTTKMVQWQQTGVLKMGPITRDDRTEAQRMEATPFLLHDIPDKFSPEVAKQAVSLGAELLNHFVGLGTDELGAALEKLGKSAVGDAFASKWTDLLNALNYPESAPKGVQGAFEGLNEITSNLKDKVSGPLIDKFASAIARQVSVLAQGQRSEQTWDYDHVMQGLDAALDSLK